MGSNRKIDELLVDTYVERFEELQQLFPCVITQHRASAIESFRLLGLPDKSNEKYKYSDIKTLFQQKYRDFELSFCGGESGKVRTESNGVMCGDLGAFAKENEAVTDRYYNTIADNTEALSALNTAYVSGGHAIYVPKGVTVEEPFEVGVKGWCDEHGRVIVGRRDLFVFERGARAKVVVNFDKRIGLVNRLCEIFVEEGAHVEVVEIHSGSGAEDGVCVNSVYVHQGKDSTFQSTVVALGRVVVRNNQTVVLDQPGATCNLFGATVVDGEGLVDHFTDIQHQSPDATSYEHFKAIAGDKAVSAFNGRIYVAKDAQRTQSFQANNNILLNDTAHVYAKPQLEIYADDVKCSHGSTMGQLDGEAIYYMRQRGIGLLQARRLQMLGFVSDVVQKIGVDTLRREVEEALSAMIIRN